MPYVKVKTGCKTCKIAYGNSKLSSRIYYAYFERKDEDETLSEIAKEIGVSTSMIYRHCTKHLVRSKTLKPMRVERKILEDKKKFHEDLTKHFDSGAVVPKEQYEEALDRVIADGMQELKEGRTKVSVSQLLVAVKIKSDDHNKKRGQDLELVKSMYRMSSGKQKAGYE